MFKEGGVVSFVGRGAVVEVERYVVISGKLFREVGKGGGPASDNVRFFTLGVFGDGVV